MICLYAQKNDRLSCTHVLPSWRNLPSNVTSDFLFRTFDSVQNPTRKWKFVGPKLGQALPWIFWSSITTLPMGWLLNYTSPCVFPDFNPMNCSFFKSLLVNVKLMLRKILGQQTPGGKDVFSGPIKGTNSTAKISRPGRVRCSGFGGAARNRHMFGVWSGVVGIWRIWTLIGGTGGLGRQSGPQNLPHVFCFPPFYHPPKKKWTNVPWKGTISKRKNRIPSPWFFRVNKSLFFTRCFWRWNFITISFGIWQIFKFQTASTRVTQ